MPELPEVEAARRVIENHCVGKKIVKSIVADDTKVIDGVSPADFQAALIGKTIVAARRKGKNMWIQLDSPPFPSFQFGMAGAVYIKGVAVTNYKRAAVTDTDEWPSKYSKVFVELDDGLEFSFTDKRRFAKVRLLDDPASKPPISELGPDALFEPMTVNEFSKSLSKKKIGIKALLLDQGFISGIGNWMADEVLYQAKIHPLQSSSSISKENCATLLKCINEVTKLSVEVDADSLRFPVEWMFHYRWGKKPGKVDGKKIEFINAGGRTSAIVPEFQKLTGSQAVKEAAKPAKAGNDKDDADEFDNEEDSKQSKVTKGRKTTNAKKPSSKKKATAKTEDSDNEDDDGDDSDNISKSKRGVKKIPVKSKPKGHNENVEAQTRGTRGKRAPAKRKHKESDDDDDDVSYSSGNDDGDEEEAAQEMTNGKMTKVGVPSKKAVASSQVGKQKKKAN